MRQPVKIRPDADDRPILFVGDIQGCSREFALLLQKAGFRPGAHRLIALGDAVNRGPDAPGVLDLLAGTGAEPILGNHELGLLAVLRNEREHPWAGRPQYAQAQLREAGRWERDMAAVAGWPLFREGAGRIAVHAGLHPRLSPGETGEDFLTTVRFCDGEGNLPSSLPKGQLDAPAGYRPWYEFYQGSRMVFFGHWAQRGLIVRGRLRGLDTECVYGRHLTGIWWPEDRVIQVDAAEIYYPAGGRRKDGAAGD